LRKTEEKSKESSTQMFQLEPVFNANPILVGLVSRVQVQITELKAGLSSSLNTRIFVISQWSVREILQG
jgi:hypothetical protein